MINKKMKIMTNIDYQKLSIKNAQKKYMNKHENIGITLTKKLKSRKNFEKNLKLKSKICKYKVTMKMKRRIKWSRNLIKQLEDA